MVSTIVTDCDNIIVEIRIFWEPVVRAPRKVWKQSFVDAAKQQQRSISSKRSASTLTKAR